MNLGEIRAQLVRTTGRYDLVTDAVDFVDNGANFYINAGITYLDRLETVKKSLARSFPEIHSGDWYALVQNCRAIKEVWCSNNSGERWQLEKKDFSLLRTAFNELPAQLSGGSPCYYSPIQSLRNAAETDGQMTIDYFASEETTEASDNFTYDGIIFMPPSDSTYRLEIVGLFNSAALTDDDDENYWSAVYPLALVMAAARAIEITYRNTQGTKDWEYSINMELHGIGLDLIEEEIAAVTQMEG